MSHQKSTELALQNPNIHQQSHWTQKEFSNIIWIIHFKNHPLCKDSEPKSLSHTRSLKCLQVLMKGDWRKREREKERNVYVWKINFFFFFQYIVNFWHCWFNWQTQRKSSKSEHFWDTQLSQSHKHYQVMEKLSLWTFLMISPRKQNHIGK